jgi:hypothetical protein
MFKVVGILFFVYGAICVGAAIIGKNHKRIDLDGITALVILAIMFVMGGLALFSEEKKRVEATPCSTWTWKVINQKAEIITDGDTAETTKCIMEKINTYNGRNKHS